MNSVKYLVKDCEEEILLAIDQQNGFGDNPRQKMVGMGFYEFGLDELGLPTAQELLDKTNAIKDAIDLKGWHSNGSESKTYKGFSLSYNPDFVGHQTSIYHQTFGDLQLPQNFGRERGVWENKSIKNTYYDSFAFRHQPPLVKTHFGDFLNKFSMPLLRSRMAWNYGMGLGEQKLENWHVDEFPFCILRINIPLQTSPEHVIDIVGKDDCGNELNIVNKHLEVGKAYIWNTRIPHRVTLKELCQNPEPRIHMVLGFGAWFSYDKDEDSFSPNHAWGKNLDYIVRNKLFLKQ